MKSIKPGRGPSLMGGIVGIFMICFGVLWTALAAQGGGFFALFGVLWTGIAVVQTIYNFKNATGKNRYSQYDITENGEESDSLNERYGSISDESKHSNKINDNNFCPYCGTKVLENFEYCNKCGKKLP